MLTDRIHNRWQAFAVHLLISFIIFIVLAAIIRLWYPGILFMHDGGFEGIKLIAGVDLIIGPLLTLMVFNRSKKSLKKDLSVIAGLQLACLVAGMWTVYQTRPVAVVYSEGAFRSIAYQIYNEAGIDIESNKLFAERWPVWIAVSEQAPKARDGKTGLQNIAGFFQVKYYQPYQEQLVAIGQHGKKPEQIKAFPIASLAAAKSQPEAVWYFPAALSSGAGFIGIDMTTGEATDFAMDLNREKYLLDYWSDIRDFWQKTFK